MRNQLSLSTEWRNQPLKLKRLVFSGLPSSFPGVSTLKVMCLELGIETVELGPAEKSQTTDLWFGMLPYDNLKVAHCHVCELQLLLNFIGRELSRLRSLLN
jgi:hypothetical protein